MINGPLALLSLTAVLMGQAANSPPPARTLSGMEGLQCLPDELPARLTPIAERLVAFASRARNRTDAQKRELWVDVVVAPVSTQCWPVIREPRRPKAYVHCLWSGTTAPECTVQRSGPPGYPESVQHNPRSDVIVHGQLQVDCADLTAALAIEDPAFHPVPHVPDVTNVAEGSWLVLDLRSSAKITRGCVWGWNEGVAGWSASPGAMRATCWPLYAATSRGTLLPLQDNVIVCDGGKGFDRPAQPPGESASPGEHH